MRLRDVADAEQRISSLPVRSASKFTEKRARTGFARPGVAALRPESDQSSADRALIFCFDAFSLCDPASAPDQVRGRPVPTLRLCSGSCSRFLTDDTEI